VTYRVDTPGGSLEVELTEHQTYLTGPAVLVAHGELALPERAVLQTQTRPAVSGSPGLSSN
jgi:diaminopimelate epimerase